MINNNVNSRFWVVKIYTKFNTYISNLILISLILFSCNSEIKNTDKKDNSNILNKNHIIEKEKNLIEDFDVFFERYRRDSVFQKERTNDVLLFFSYPDEENLKVSKHTKEDFDFFDYTEDDLAYNKESNAYKVKLEVETDSIIYYRLGIDNGIHMFEVYKVVKNDKWYLTAIHDYSH